MTHTPGPWKIFAVGDGNRLCPADQSNQSILTIEEEDGVAFACVYEEADAYLIVAAPDLLAVAKRILDRGYVSESIDEESADHQALVAAIVKATGSQSPSP